MPRSNDCILDNFPGGYNPLKNQGQIVLDTVDDSHAHCCANILCLPEKTFADQLE